MIRTDFPCKLPGILNICPGIRADNYRLRVTEVQPTAEPREWVQLNTVRCSFRKHSKSAFLEYKSNTPGIDKLPSIISRSTTDSGVHLSCKINKNRMVAKAFAALNRTGFEIRNLDSNADYAWVLQLLATKGLPVPKKGKVESAWTAEYNEPQPTDREFCEYLDLLMRSYGPMGKCLVQETARGVKQALLGTYYNQEDAIQVSSLPPSGEPRWQC